MNTRQFVEKYRVRMTADWIAERPDGIEGWGHGANHYRCVLRVARRRMTVYFTMGSAHTAEPTAAEVLDCLASDAASVVNARDFTDWASDLGYDTDSRKAEQTYQACVKSTADLRRLLGVGAADVLMFRTERL